MTACRTAFGPHQTSHLAPDLVDQRADAGGRARAMLIKRLNISISL
jgi:hypothetical protein